MDPIAIPASDFIGKRVYAVETAVDADEYDGVQEGWNDIGEINDIILTRDAKVDAVLIDIGGFLGMGERQIAVGMENIRFVSDSATAEDLNDFFLVVNADKAVLESAPEYMRTGALPADTTKTDDTAKAEKTNIPAVDEAMATNDQAEVAVSEPVTNPALVGGAMAVDGYAAVDASSVTSEQLMGVRVYGPNDEDLGEISDLVLDGKGAPAQIIIDVGGFLGMGEKPVAIEVTTLQILKETDGAALRAYVQMTQDELKALPAAKR
jgi:sporulation protein YlmC with PRC-barrel domain